MNWMIIGIEATPERLTVLLQNGTTTRRVYIGAGELAAVGHSGKPLYDGKPAQGGAA